MTIRFQAFTLVVCMVVGLPGSATPSGTADDPAQGTVWDLSPLFRDDATWNSERIAVQAEIPALAGLKVTLGESATAFLQTLDQISRMTQRLERLGEYADLQADADGSSDTNQARVQQISALQAQFEQVTSFVRPAILALGRERIEALERAEPGLARHRRPLELILRRAAHTLSPEAESLLAASGPLRRQPGAIHDVLMYSDMPWPAIEIDGRPTPLAPAAYRATLFNVDRDIRRKAFESVNTTLGHFEGTAGAIAFSFLSSTAFEAKARHYSSSLALALSDDAMPETHFRTMAAEADKALPAVLRYLNLRKQLLGVNELHVYDLQVPLATNPHRYRLDEAEALILRALAPLGDDYVRALQKGFQSHAMHAIAQRGKNPGALTDAAAYGVQPFVLLTFNGTFDSVSAVAHEWGHALHSQLYQSAQPFENADITSTFLFDTPSLMNEMLLADYMIANARTREEKISALDHAIDLLRYSYFAVISEVEYEIKAHEAVDRGDAVTGKDLREMYCPLRKHSIGADAGVTTFEESACLAWVNRPGIYYDFYFYKYLTAVSAAGFFIDSLEKRDADARRRFFDLLKAGGSDDPYVLLKRAGFDAASPAAYQPIVQRMERLVAQLEAVAARPN